MLVMIKTETTKLKAVMWYVNCVVASVQNMDK